MRMTIARRSEQAADLQRHACDIWVRPEGPEGHSHPRVGLETHTEYCVTSHNKRKETKLGETDRFSSHLKPLVNVVNWATHGRLGVQVLRGDWSETPLLTLSQAPREKAGG